MNPRKSDTDLGSTGPAGELSSGKRSDDVMIRPCVSRQTCARCGFLKSAHLLAHTQGMHGDGVLICPTATFVTMESGNSQESPSGGAVPTGLSAGLPSKGVGEG